MNTGTRYHNRRKRSRYVRTNDLITHQNRIFYHELHKFGGKLDVCREQEDHIIAVEYKRFKHRNQPRNSHIIQAVVGGLAAEYELQKPLNFIEIQYYRGRRVQIEIDKSIRLKTIGYIEEIREIIQSGNLPEPVENKNKCTECEFYKMCYSV